MSRSDPIHVTSSRRYAINAKQLIALSVLAVAGGAAFADDITVANDAFTSQKTRAEVTAEVLQARAGGQLQFASEMGVGTPTATMSTLTRDQVRAELRNAPKAKVAMYNDAA